MIKRRGLMLDKASKTAGSAPVCGSGPVMSSCSGLIMAQKTVKQLRLEASVHRIKVGALIII